jgi:hypothetical protein
LSKETAVEIAIFVMVGLAPWKNQPWARDLEHPEFRESHDPPTKPDDR